MITRVSDQRLNKRRQKEGERKGGREGKMELIHILPYGHTLEGRREEG